MKQKMWYLREEEEKTEDLQSAQANGHHWSAMQIDDMRLF